MEQIRVRYLHLKETTKCHMYHGVVERSLDLHVIFPSFQKTKSFWLSAKETGVLLSGKSTRLVLGSPSMLSYFGAIPTKP